jgi:sugar lactone lactonase YvrE
MKKWIAAVLALAAGVIWWIAAAPRPEIKIAESIVIDPSTRKLIEAVDDSAGFSNQLETFPSSLPHFDDVVYLENGRALATAIDGKIWSVDLATHAAQPMVDPPLMAYGIHEAPGDPNHVYFCASRSYSAASPSEAVGLYRLALDDLSVQPIVLEVPATDLDNERPIVYADSDSKAPELRPGAGTVARRALVVCDNLEVSEDGRRIYFSEPFDYAGASVDDAVDEAVALAPNGRLWRHDVDSGATRLIAEGFHFINGVLYDVHPGQPREDSVLVTQTSLFRLTRFNLRGPKAGSAEVVLDGITGMNDGMDRDSAGRIWLALFTERGSLLTWVHAHAWLKPLFMRLPARLLLRRQRPTGVLVVSPDGRKPLYAAMYEGPLLASIASAVPAKAGIYLANESLSSSDRDQTGIVRLRWPRQLLVRE